MSNVTTIPNLPPVYPVTRNEKGQLVHQTPEQLHPGMIGGESDAAKYARQVFADCSQRLASFNAKWMRRDARLGDEVRQYRGEGFDNARADTKAEIARHDDALKLASGFKPDPNMTTLVVGTFQAMKPHERAGAIAKLIDQNDGPTLAILDSVSNVYTGLSDELKATIKDRLYSKTDPQTYAAWNTAKGNLDRIDRASRVMIEALAKFASGPDVAANEEVHSVAHGFSAA